MYLNDTVQDAYSVFKKIYHYFYNTLTIEISSCKNVKIILSILV